MSAALSEPASRSEPVGSHDFNHYERACDQAIAMCDGNLRSTIKALIMANEYLEMELGQLQVTVCGHGTPAEPTADNTSDAA
jgi:predicted class III extradiol MEMO1 family dioxygenase